MKFALLGAKAFLKPIVNAKPRLKLLFFSVFQEIFLHFLLIIINFSRN